MNRSVTDRVKKEIKPHIAKWRLGSANEMDKIE